jgi:hypothetical protein
MTQKIRIVKNSIREKYYKTDKAQSVFDKKIGEKSYFIIR